MNRGLKVNIELELTDDFLIVTFTSPMNRGLKVGMTQKAPLTLLIVTFTSPMNRGLKAPLPFTIPKERDSYIYFPDE